MSGKENNSHCGGFWEKRVFVFLDGKVITYRCTECGTTCGSPTKFCPNCGANMELGVQGKDSSKSMKNTEKWAKIVRCKDCRYSVDCETAGFYCEHPDNRYPFECQPTDYCSYGEGEE